MWEAKKSLWLGLLLFGSITLTVHAFDEVQRSDEADAQRHPVRPDHSVWQSLLDRYLSKGEAGIYLFAYRSVTDTDKQRLKAYLRQLTGLNPGNFAKPVQLAYWINLYNAATVDLVLDNYPVKSITSIHEGLFSFGPWDDPLFSIAGQTFSLNAIEHGILRPGWRDHRIHYVLNCASMGCPDLNPQALTASNVYQIMTGSEERFIRHPRGVRRAGSRLILSKIFKWYRDDFADNEDGLRRYLAGHLGPELAQAIMRKDYSLSYAYDWSLNEKK